MFLKALTFLFISACSISSVLADTSISFEEGMNPVPKSFRKLYPGTPNSDGACFYNGKRIRKLDQQRELWVVVSSCSGSGGADMSLAVKSANGVVMVKDADLDLELTISDTVREGFPDVATQSGGNCCGTHVANYVFDGKKYKLTAKRDEYPLFRESHALSKDLAKFIKPYAGKNQCVLDGLMDADVVTIQDIDFGESGGPQLSLVAARCDADGELPIWILSSASKPRLLLQTTVPDSDIIVGPQGEHGLPKLCFEFSDTDPGAKKDAVQTRCWDYSENVYKPGPVPIKKW